MKKYFLVILVSNFLMSSAYSQNVYKWRLAQTWPKEMPLFSDVSKEMAKVAKELSNGRLLITIDAKEDHKRALGVFDMVKKGEYQMGHSASYYWKNIDINMQFFATVPMGMVAVEQFAWFYKGGGAELMERAYEKYGLLSFPGGNTGNQMGGWFRNEIKSLADVKGLKVRIPGIAGDIFKELGAEPVLIPGGELYDALKSGRVDGLEWVGPSIDMGMKFHEIVDYYYTGWHEPATMLQFMVNKKAYDTLPEDLQNILLVSMRIAAYDNYVDTYHASAVNLKKLRANFPNIKIRAFPNDVRQALKEKTDLKVSEIARDGDDLTKEIVDSIQSYGDKVRWWTRISDQAYLNNTAF